MNYYGNVVSGAGWIVPKKYMEQVGPDGFKKHPIGLGPYKFVSHTVGVELVMEAFEGYWRKMPSVKRVVFKMVPESTTRVAMLKRGEVDIAYLLEAPQAIELKRDPNVRLAFSGGIAVFFLDFLDMWDPKSPWADQRVRLAASLALDRRSLRRGGDARRLEASGQLRAAYVRVRAAARAASVRPGAGEEATGGGGLPQRLRRGRVPPAAAVLRPRRGRSSATSAPSASGRRCGRWSVRRISRRFRPRSSRACASARARSTATPPRGCRK